MTKWLLGFPKKVMLK